MTRAEHLEWCKKRAFAYLEKGDAKQAVASMMSDLRKHPETEDTAKLTAGLALSVAINNDPKAARKFIAGFN